MKRARLMSACGRGAGRRPRGFTLIEVLTVIALLTMLLLATLPAFRSARSSAQRHAAASEALEIAGAALEFRRVYGSWPGEEETKEGGTVLTAGRPRKEGESGPGLSSYDLDIGEVVQILIGDDDAKSRSYNPRALQFLELSRSCLRQKEGDARAYPYDPWGQPYVLVMARTIQEGRSGNEKVSRIEGGIAFSTTGCAFKTPDDAAVFSWGDPTMITNEAAPTRIVGSWSAR